MTKQEQIEKLAESIEFSKCSEIACQSCKFEKMPASVCFDTFLATKLVKLGYGNMKAFFEELYEKIDKAGCEITINCDDVKRLAKKYGYSIG